jgi:glycerol kinase
MEADTALMKTAGGQAVKLNELKVDGGATANNTLMQVGQSYDSYGGSRERQC